jgi:hypothetical protein
MAKKSNPYGTGLYHKRTKPKRKGRHSKRPNKKKHSISCIEDKVEE